MNFLNNKTVHELLDFGKENHDAYINAKPFPNGYYDNLFNPEMLREIIAEFPEIGKVKEDIQYTNPNELKLATKGEYRFGEKTKAFIHFLNSQPFLEFLQNLTGIKETLIPDPYLEGGGFHEIKPGGYLKMHVDFHKNQRTNLDRRLNILVYLNEDWKDEYGGHFELWEKDMSKCVTKIAPLFNRLAMFSTTDFSWHGLPDPLTCPPDRSRRSIALYYYTNGRPEGEVNVGDKGRITTTFATRKGQDSTKMTIFNSFVNFANDILPPFLVRLIKKFRNT
ncbi:MAG TPA: 2OG-Fe(II) oxygenase [Chitinophagales bacterium]|nr:2OG-Fe(II) oxygenase [Chitinophagales bacterium]HNE85818.1 2OG-Fe(II) oxygenase [Chitinophagales bacterium]HNJ10351.1 2OG-Fe(II) oxygenase [Chitinophagales bacterium]HNK90271.1 2OG-Fe(II) oxygenase [Chitinophagales bacterium]HNL16498.1 2OG-Fe(II) oxygenase [Chitinophagales bacterium]